VVDERAEDVIGECAVLVGDCGEAMVYVGCQSHSEGGDSPHIFLSAEATTVTPMMHR
jgi:hypothetical protein